MLTRVEHILAKVETVKGVDAAPAVGVDGVLVVNPAWKLEGLDMIGREGEVGSGLLADRQAIVSGFLKTVIFDVRANGPGEKTPGKEQVTESGNANKS